MQDPLGVAGDIADDIARCKNVAAASVLYRRALRMYGPGGLDWSVVNHAVLHRWSARTLNSIKAYAWKTDRQAARGEG